MVKKLIKHEFIYYFRTFIIILPIMLFSGITVRIIYLFKNDSIAYNLSFSSATTILFFASFVCLLMSLILGIIRFYKNLYSSEGYLTFALPVSYQKHILSKLIAFVSCQLVSLLVVIISWLIAIGGIDEIGIVLDEISDSLAISENVGHFILMAFELIILFIVSIISNTLLFYACISIGQLAKKNRILLAIVAYYVYNIALEVLATIVMIILISASSNMSFESLEAFINNNPFSFFHIIFWIGILLISAFGYIFYRITLHIMKNKLNLE